MKYLLTFQVLHETWSEEIDSDMAAAYIHGVMSVGGTLVDMEKVEQ